MTKTTPTRTVRLSFAAPATFDFTVGLIVRETVGGSLWRLPLHNWTGCRKCGSRQPAT